MFSSLLCVDTVGFPLAYLNVNVAYCNIFDCDYVVYYYTGSSWLVHGEEWS